jgi:hypothetical protein
MTRHTSLRSQLYRAARDMGTLQAVEVGSTSYAGWLARRKIYAKSNGLARRLTRGLGL